MCSNILLNLFLMHVLLFGVYMYHIIGVVLEAVLITAFKDPHRVLFIQDMLCNPLSIYYDTRYSSSM